MGIVVAGVAGVAAVVLVVAGLVAAFVLLAPMNSTIDSARVEQEIIRVKQVETGSTPTDVAVPQVAVGSTFQWTATLDGQLWTYEVTQQDDQAGCGSAAWT